MREANTMNTNSYAKMVEDGRDIISVLNSVPEDKRMLMRAMAGAYIDGMIAQEQLAAQAEQSEETIVASSPESVQQAPVGDPLQNLDAAAKQQLLLKLLSESPDMSALLTALAGRSA